MGRRSAPSGRQARVKTPAAARLRLDQPNVLKSVLIPLPYLFFSLPFFPGQLKRLAWSSPRGHLSALPLTVIYFSVYYAGLFLLILPVSPAQDDELPLNRESSHRD